MLSLLAALAPFAARAQQADRVPPASRDAEILWHEAPTLAPIQLIFPEGFSRERSWPLVVALHGYGGSAARFRRVGDRLAAAGFVVALPEATYPTPTAGGIGFDWTLMRQGDPAVGARATRLLVERYLPEAVADIRRRYAIDRVFVLGFSQGALVALLTGVRNDTVFDGAVGFGLPAFQPAWLGDDGRAGPHSPPVLLLHGADDDRAPVAVSRAARDSLSAAGFDITFRQFAGGHVVPGDQLALAARWMLNQGRAR
ncbi:MAG TPA: dienelactone hydrolase family protein [Gemmatimonadales bacterium]|nr:dienelactone hydrolase family protein [Gemmatimonadales bacterium]